MKLIPPRKCKVYTPAPLATAMLRQLGDNAGYLWLEPSYGKGAFLDALATIGVPADRITAIDLDQRLQSNDNRARCFKGVEFLEWAKNTSLKFDRIVGNPPFVSMSKLSPRLKSRAISTCDIDNRTQIPGSANLWYAFICASLRLLRKDASFAFVLPAALEYADYAARLRRHLPRVFDQVWLHRSKRPLFDEVSDGSVVLIAKGFQRKGRVTVRVEHDSRESLISNLDSARMIPHGISARFKYRLKYVSTKNSLNNFLTLRLGAVTGDANFFLLSEEKRIAARIPKNAVIPVLSKARHLNCDRFVCSHFEKLAKKNDRIWLFRPNEVQAKRASVKKYLSMKKSMGGCNRDAFKVRCRKPWYKTPLPPQPHGFMSGMSNAGPFIMFNGMKRLTATNTLYTIRFHEGIGLGDRYKVAIALQTSNVIKSIVRKCRVYPDGLVKLEPKDINSIQIPALPNKNGAARCYRKIIKQLLMGRSDVARGLADQYFISQGGP